MLETVLKNSLYFFVVSDGMCCCLRDICRCLRNMWGAWSILDITALPSTIYTCDVAKKRVLLMKIWICPALK